MSKDKNQLATVIRRCNIRSYQELQIYRHKTMMDVMEAAVNYEKSHYTTEVRPHLNKPGIWRIQRLKAHVGGRVVHAAQQASIAVANHKKLSAKPSNG